MNNADRAAFPYGSGEECATGLTKREYFVAAALMGLCAETSERFAGGETMSKIIAQEAIQIADAILVELEKEKK